MTYFPGGTVQQATGVPGTADDANAGYVVGSIRVDVAAQAAYVCIDNTPGAAVWHRIDQQGLDSVASVFGRTGAVVAQSGDYAASQVTNDSSVAGADVATALNNLQAAIPIFGTEYQQAESLPESSTTSTTLQSKVSLTTGNLPTGNYIVLWSAILNSTSEEVIEVQVQVDGTAKAIVFDKPELNKKERTAMGQIFLANYSGTHTIEILYRSTVAGKTVSILDARLSIWRVS